VGAMVATKNQKMQSNSAAYFFGGAEVEFGAHGCQ